jgi:uncharacterized protein
MPRQRPLLLLFLTLIAALPSIAQDINNIHPTSYVTDLAGVIPSAIRDRLESLCSELQQKTGAQFAIITVVSLDDRPIEDYANALFHHLEIGQKGQNNGLLLLLAPRDRKYRIEVGYGLEPIINDARAGDAGRAMVPFLRQSDYGSAVEIASWQLAKFIADDKGVTLSAQPPARPVRTVPQSDKRIAFPYGFALIIFLLIVARIFSFATSRRGMGGGGCVDGCLWAALLNAAGGRRGGWGSSSDWGGGGFGGGGGDSGGGFGGFGGGDSGGGGASGSW